MKTLLKGFAKNKLLNLVEQATRAATVQGRAIRPTPQDIAGYFFVWKSLRENWY